MWLATYSNQGAHRLHPVVWENILPALHTSEWPAKRSGIVWEHLHPSHSLDLASLVDNCLDLKEHDPNS